MNPLYASNSPSQGFHQPPVLNGLGNIAIETVCQDLLAIARHGAGRDREHDDVAQGFVAADFSKRCDPVQLGQRDIHQDDVRGMAPGQCKAFATVARLDDVVVRFDECLHGAQVVEIVLHHQTPPVCHCVRGDVCAWAVAVASDVRV
jgi:hypothetical protein